MQECNPSRNSQLRLIETVRSRGRSNQMLCPRPIHRHRIDRLPMPRKTHATSCGAAAFFSHLHFDSCFVYAQTVIPEVVIGAVHAAGLLSAL